MTILKKTFGGLQGGYHLRQLFFGGLMGSLMIAIMLNSEEAIHYGFVTWVVISTLLYPYARLAYESVIGFLLGNNTFYVNALLMLAIKLTTMLLCWGFALFVAPFGLIYLYFCNSRTIPSSE